MIRRIEMIGASGVGKSTFLPRLVELRAQLDGWLTPAELKLQIAQEIARESKGLTRRSLLARGMFRSKHQEWTNDLLSKHLGKASESNIQRYSGYIDLNFNGLARSLIMCPRQKRKMANFYFERVQELCLFDYFDCEDCVIFDDGILHNNVGFSNIKAVEEFLVGRPSFERSLLPIAIIHCTCDLKTNLERRTRRVDSGLGTFVEHGRSEAQLMELCSESVDHSERIAEVMESLGVPTMKVDLTETDTKALDKVLSFVRSIALRPMNEVEES